METESLDEHKIDEYKITRRDFLRTAMVGVGAMLLKPQIRVAAEALDQTDNSFDKAAKSYIANTHEKATIVAQNIMMNKGASPSNMCGPLATSILMGWKLNPDGTISNISDNSTNLTRMEGIIPEDMWLGRPDDGSKRYDIAFPESKYNRYCIKESIGSLDFNNIPDVGELKPGDFLFLDGGSFTHYIAISRKDKEGRLYCVSNVHTDKKNEFEIKELMLWDPTIKDGFFRKWATGVGTEHAKTGIAGFYLWRRKESTEQIVENSVTQKYRNAFLNEMRNQKKGVWNIYINEIGKGEIFEWRDGVPYHCASTIKVPISILVMQSIKQEYGEEIATQGLDSVLKTRGIDGRSFDQLISAMLVNSEEEATESLANYSKKKADVQEGFKQLGMENTTYEPRRSTQKDLFECWRALFTNKVVDNDAKEYIIKKLGEYTENDDTLIGEVRKRFPGARQWNKRGTITSGMCTVQDTGIIEIPTSNGRRYFYIGVAGNSTQNKEISYEDSVAFITSLMVKLSDYIQESSIVRDSRINYRSTYSGATKFRQ